MVNANYSRLSPEDEDGTLAFESLMSDLASVLDRLPPDEEDRRVEDVLRRICELLGVDSAVLWQESDVVPRAFSVTHSYCPGGGPQCPEAMLQEHFPYSSEQILAGRVVRFSSWDEMPAEAAVDRENAERFGIVSSLSLPISVGGESPRACLAFNATGQERGWPDVLVTQLQLVAQALAHALALSRAEEAYRTSETRAEAAADLADLAFLEVDFGAGILTTDDRLADLLGVTPTRQEGLQPIQFWVEHLHPDDAPHALDVRRQVIEGEREQFLIEYRYMHPSRGERWIQHVARATVRDAAGRAVRTVSVLRDITRSKRNEQDVHDLSRRMIRAHEEERAALARELHDDVSQRLAVLAINVGRAELATPQGEQAEAMRAVREGLVRLSDDVHSLAYQLHPAILEELGLAEALRTEGERHRSRGLHVWVHLDPSLAAVDDDLALCLFRVTQEALNNVTRHAEATVATVRLRRTDDGLLLAVSDNGVGFDPADPKTTGSLGLVSMRERARLVNGTLEIESAPGRGTTVIAWVPAEEAI